VSVVRLCKATLVGCSPEKKSVLESLQDLGCLHIIPLAEGTSTSDTGSSSKVREALRFLLESPNKFRQVTQNADFDALKIQNDTLALRDRLDALIAERDHLKILVDERRPWGNFKPPTPAELNGQRLWLYRVPSFQRKEVEASRLHWEIVGHDDRFDYVAVLAEREPPAEAMPVSALHSDERSLGELEARLEKVELAIQDAEAERASLTRWCLLLTRSMNRLDDQAELERAQAQTRDVEPVFALQAWVPHDRLPELQWFAKEKNLVLEISDPDPSETPPTQFHNPDAVAGGEELVLLYMTPSYWIRDPSPVVFFSFALFFSMIISDAGYGLLMALLTLAMWKRLGGSVVARRWRSILAWISGLSIVYGVLVGSYFGVEPRSGFLKSLHLVNMRNYGQMMLLSALIGAAHVTLANLMNAWRFGRDPRGLAPLGWAAVICGGMTLLLGSKAGSVIATRIGIGAMVCGALLIVLFTAADKPWGKRLLGGALGMTKVTTAFGDVLSYLRLFALGLASASLASVFNGMADGLRQKSAGFGLLCAILILLFGHVVNFVLSLSSGFIHGLRLNVIEFFNWGVQEEGKSYRPFVRKETVPWNL
jgi:V/A-type H+-transporting ATPase subunit I